MKRSRAVGWSLLAWSAVAVFWFVTTRDRHPTTALAVIVTVPLIVAYACASYVNHLVLVPRYMKTRRYGRYGLSLLATMIVLTGLALAVIRIAYASSQGPDPDPNGVYVHYGIDFFGMAVHVSCAAIVVWIYRRFARTRGECA